ncbi:class A beta-lactamase-related serine hydrolase [Actinoplanes sp. NEAU-A12]|uniref:Class A beta-lactamase-related serine hydrolase n=1 Tax=Actinoplanes sandaracinus TaxID=3045177 RepID=A0ABT6WSJ8_9ACTN|nr:serine hydrolase [Actinoplanes sandaracinus]MDI6102717.1 class A beta-lactamase-related serine hydrolase [Actinoplanes sandaracinus]
MPWPLTVETEIARLAARVHAHARDIDTGAVTGLGADDVVPIASTFKVLVLLELFLRAETGDIDLTERITVTAEDRTPGPTGLSVFRDPVELSLRDAALLMMSVSDNTASDMLVRRLGLDRINATAARLGLTRTRVPIEIRELFTRHAHQLGYESLTEFFAAERAPLEVEEKTDMVTGNDSIRGTAAELTALLGLIWRDEAGPPAVCAETRRMLRYQVNGSRLASGFGDAAVTVVGKTGTVPYARGECGVVEYPDGGRYAVAVLLRHRGPGPRLPDHDRLIGSIAAALIGELRSR